MNEQITIAVDPGRTTLGVAIFQGTSLRYYAVKVLRVPGTPEDVRHAASQVLGSLIDRFLPTHLAIEQPLRVQRRAVLLNHVIDALKATAQQRGLTISEHSPEAVRRRICEDAAPTKREVARRLAARYPELDRYVSSQNRWAELYRERMFGALAVGVMHALVQQESENSSVSQK